MKVTPREIRIYEAKDGKAPFSEWLNQLKDVDGRGAIQARLVRIRLGNLGDSKPVGEGVSELRIDLGPGYRVYFGLDGNTWVILLCGGSKATQKKDISQAKEFWTDYRRRKDAKDKKL